MNITDENIDGCKALSWLTMRNIFCMCLLPERAGTGERRHTGESARLLGKKKLHCGSRSISECFLK